MFAVLRRGGTFAKALSSLADGCVRRIERAEIRQRRRSRGGERGERTFYLWKITARTFPRVCAGNMT